MLDSTVVSPVTMIALCFRRFHTQLAADRLQQVLLFSTFTSLIQESSQRV